MKLLHTADWHVGRTIRGRSRAAEHRDVLSELVTIATDHEVDLVVVAGDQFDVQAPSPEAEQIVWRTLQDLAEVAPVVVIAGNHDNPRRLDAVRSLLTANAIHAVGTVRRPEDGGVVSLDCADGTPVNVALLPFLHHRSAVRAIDLLDPAKADGEYGAAYADLYARFAHGLCATMDPAEVNLLVGHVTAFGGLRGGGEREAHTIERYCVDARAVPDSLDYVALGHLHRAQQVASAPPVRYAGSPLMMDFGESDKPCSATLVTLGDGPAKAEEVPLRSGRPLHTLRGTLEQVLAQDDQPDAWLRLLLSGPVPAGVAEIVRTAMGDGVVDVRLDAARDDEPDEADLGDRLTRPPQELFTAYMQHQQVTDERIGRLFATLLEDELSLDRTAAHDELDDDRPEETAHAAA